MSLKDLECFKKVKTINFVETYAKRGFEDAWLYNQAFEFEKENVEIINFDLKEAKSILCEISNYLYKLSNKKNNKFRDSYLVISSIKQEYRGLKKLTKKKGDPSYHLTFLLSLIKSLKKSNI